MSFESDATFSASESDATSNSRRSLASLLSPIQAQRTETEYGYQLITSADAPGPIMLAMSAQSDAPSMQIVLIPTTEPGVEQNPGASMARLARFALQQYAEGMLVLPADAALLIATTLPARGWAVVLVDGPVEDADATAMRAALRRGESPLQAEFRAVAALHQPREGVMVVDARDTAVPSAVIAQKLQRYVASLPVRDLGPIEPPPTWQIDRLLSVSGTMTIRPIETEVFSTFIDIGISTDGDDETLPANRALIYDIFSDSWHDEE